MKQKTISREELYDLVWSKTLTSLESVLRTNTHQIKKICKKMNVPVPIQGYWSKLKHNKKVAQVPLSKDYSGDKFAIFPPTLNARIWSHKALIQELESDPDLSLDVPDKLNKSNKYIRQVRDFLSGQKVYEGLKWSRSGYLNINTSPKNVKRALRIMNCVMGLLEQRGHRIEVGKETVVWLYDYDITMRLFEARKKEATNDWRGYKFVPTGKLKFQYGYSFSRSEIIEGTIPLEKQLARIIANMEIFASKRVEERRKSRAHFQKLRDEENRIKAIEERKEQELENVKQLIRDSTMWEKAKIVRAYIEHISTGNEDEIEWLKWAYDKADWLDPTLDRQDDILSIDDLAKI